MKNKNVQNFSNECGLCSIKNLLYVNGIKKSHLNLDYNVNGTSISAMLIELRKYFKVVEAIKVEAKEFLTINTFNPFIAIFKKNDITHYIVVYRKNKNSFWILDSLYKKSYKLKISEFDKYYVKIAIICEEIIK